MTHPLAAEPDVKAMTMANTVIAGAPKCGTSSLFTWLEDHPEVCGSRFKETRYFLDPGHALLDRRSNYHDHGLAGYADHFRECGGRSGPIVLEATPHYLYQETALGVLSSLDPPPTLLFLLRRPADRIYSEYQFARNNRAVIDRDMSFREFLRVVRRGEPSLRGRTQLDAVIDHSRYINYLEEWASRFPRPRLHILLFEDLQRDNRSFMKGAATVLGIDPRFYDTYGFPLKNLTYQVRYQALHRFRSAVGRRLPRGQAKTLLHKATRKVYSAVNIERIRPAKTSDDYEVLAELDREFAADNARLAREFGVDLSSWEASRTARPASGRQGG
jgi:Sulfotransferase domain